MTASERPNDTATPDFLKTGAASPGKRRRWTPIALAGVGLAVLLALFAGNGDDAAPVTLQTDANGAYQFTGLVVGQNYRVTEAQPAGYGNGTEHPTNVIDVNALPLAGVTGRDFGETLGSLAGAVFEDFSTTPANNNNGSFDGGGKPIDNATLTLTGTDLSGNPVNVTVQTNATGAYVFRDLLPPQAGDGAGALVALGAARLGATRLIDNLEL